MLALNLLPGSDYKKLLGAIVVGDFVLSSWHALLPVCHLPFTPPVQYHVS